MGKTDRREPLADGMAKHWQTFRHDLDGLSDDPRRARLAQLDTLRGIAALLIFFVHYHVLMGVWLEPGTADSALAAALEVIAHSGTDLFFTLSGFLIYGSLMTRDQSWSDYLSRRFGRIYPTFFFVVCVYLVIFLIDPAASKLPGQATQAIVYVLANLALLAGVLPLEPIVAPAWSLSYLALFYLAAPLLVWQLHLPRRQPAHRVVLFVALAVPLFAWGHFGGGPVRLVMFLAGMMLYELRPGSFGISGGRYAAALFACAVGVMALMAAFNVPAVMRYVALFVLFPLAVGASVAIPAMRGLFSWKWLRYLGRITLSYIMIHGLVLRILLLAAERFLPGGWHRPALFWGMLVPTLIATVIGAAVVYTLVEDVGD